MTGLNEDAIKALMDMTQVIAETTVGYRKRLVDGGVSVEVAEQMTRDFHDMLLTQARAGATSQPKRRP